MKWWHKSYIFLNLYGYIAALNKTPFMSSSVLPKFPVVKESLHAELRRRVQQYFDENGISATGNISLFSKAIILVTAFVVVYVHLIFFMV